MGSCGGARGAVVLELGGFRESVLPDGRAGVLEPCIDLVGGWRGVLPGGCAGRRGSGCCTVVRADGLELERRIGFVWPPCWVARPAGFDVRGGDR